ncbi:MAG: hypothetical protein QOF68_1998 [Gaiellales bacterium]|nr:hypothetical protein [Gaiellales bacterium]
MGPRDHWGWLYMRKLLAVLVAAGALVALAILGAGALAAPAAKKAPHGFGRAAVTDAAVAKAAAVAPDGTEHIVLIAREVRAQDVDVPPAGESTGDSFFFEEALWNVGRTKQLGIDSAECRLGIRTFNCAGTLLLFGRGKIQVDGAFFFDRDATIPVTGGTGQFADVGGVMVITDISDTVQRYDLFVRH